MPPLSLGPLPQASPAPSILPASPLPEIPDPTTHFREFGDSKKTRKLIYDNALKAARGLEPLTNQRHTLRLRDVAYEDREHFTPAERKHALLTGGTLARRLRGTWELLDNDPGKVIDSHRAVVARIPHLTDLGTFVHGGNDYTLAHQQRLRSGVFARRKENGELESHANILPGKGI